MRRDPGLLLLAVVLVLLAVACGGAPQTVAAVGYAQAVPTTASTITLVVTTSTVDGPPSTVAKEPALPDGARHGDQPEVAARMAGIDGLADCDLLAAEHDNDTAEADQMLATRAQEGHRARAELDGRYAEQARHRMAALGCYQIAHTQ